MKENKLVGNEIPIDKRRSAVHYGEGLRALSTRRFNDALELFELALKFDRRNPYAYSKMGIACLYLDYLIEAERYFDRALKLDRDNTEAMNGKSFVLLRSDNTIEATDLICDVLKVDPGDRLAKSNFKALKEAENLDAYIAGIHPSEFVKLPKRFFLKKNNSKAIRFLRVISWFTIIAGLFVVGFYYFNPLRILLLKGRNKPSSNPGYYYPANIQLKSKITESYKRALTGAHDTSDAVLSDEVISRLITRMRSLIQNREYNEALMILNKIMVSNADDTAKSIVKNLKKFIGIPNKDKLKYNPLAENIVKDPYYYKNVFVKWLVKTVNRKNRGFIQVAPARYHTGKARNLRVVVIGNRFQTIKRGRVLEIFGKIAGVDKARDDKLNVIFIKSKNLKILD